MWVILELNAPSSPLVCITHVVDGVVRIDKFHDLVEPSQPLRAAFVNRFAMPDYVTLYLTDDGFDLARLLNDDYFRAIKLLYQNRLFVSAAKLLMSFIDTVAYLNEGDCQGNFQRWLDTYVAMPSLGVTADEVWEFRNSLLHMTNIDSRKVTAGKIRPLLFYIGKMPTGFALQDGDAKYFNLQDMIYAVADGLEKWVSELNQHQSRTSELFRRHDRVLSDVRYEVWSHSPADDG